MGLNAETLKTLAAVYDCTVDDLLNQIPSTKPPQRDRAMQRVRQATEEPRRQEATGSLTMTFEPGGKIRVRGHIDALIDKRRFQELIDLIKPEGEGEPEQSPDG